MKLADLILEIRQVTKKFKVFKNGSFFSTQVGPYLIDVYMAKGKNIVWLDSSAEFLIRWLKENNIPHKINSGMTGIPIVYFKFPEEDDLD